MMIPALAHSCRPGCIEGVGVFRFPAGTWPVSEVTRAVMVPLAPSGWCTK